MPIDSSDLIPYLLISVKLLMILVSAVILLSGLDDLFIDICYGLRSLYRRVFVLPRYRSLSEQDLLGCPEQLIAVMTPAWDESAVIRPMLHNAVRTLNYRNFHIFVGTYPNDSDTHQEVEIVRERYDNVHRVVCPHDGPTNKADCLNWIYQGIKVFEKENGIRFKIFIMQDCEDVIHPLCYKLFNYLIPRKDMVQLPVHSMKRKWYEFTAGHYIDEFSQLHFKDLVVREHLNRSIPAAGVGCAFSRRAFEIVAEKNNNQLFSIDSLTEDYDFGFRLKEHGLKQVFVRFAITRTVMKPGFWTGKPRQARIKELVCVREYFPASYWAAVRQRSRWVLGIALQGWANLGWRGDVWTKYMLFRDRKVLLTNLVNLLGYLVVFAVLAVWMTLWLNPDAYHYPPLLEKGSALWYVVIANAYLLGERIALRAFCVQQIHGWQQAFLSIPRMVWGNIINFSATCRAISLYSRYLRTGKLISWDKTVHVFPSEAELQAFRRKLGDLLLERRLITSRQLDEALARQKVEHRLLGSILIEMGVVREDDLIEALSITQA
jgi:adsorption protein B